MPARMHGLRALTSAHSQHSMAKCPLEASRHTSAARAPVNIFTSNTTLTAGEAFLPVNTERSLKLGPRSGGG